MIVVDTSVWIDHFDGNNAVLPDLLATEQVAMHPLILGELLLGGLPRRSQTIRDLRRLPASPVASVDETLVFIEAQQLQQIGVGLVDANVVASLLLDRSFRLLTRDKRLAMLAVRLGVNFEDAAH